MIWKISLLTVLWAALHGPQPTAAEEKNAAKRCEMREYQVLVDNRPAGLHRVTTTTDGRRLEVDISADVRINYFTVYTYVYKYRAHEVWEDGQLVSIQVSSLDDGKRVKFALQADAQGLSGTFNGNELRTAAADASTAYWFNPDRANRAASVFSVLDVDTGKCSAADWRLAGRDTIAAAGKETACRHYRIGGPTPADLWFDETDHLVLQKSQEDGHSVELRLTQLKAVRK